MDRHNIIVGQEVDPVKAARAKELRRDMTETEKVLWRALRTNQLGGYHFRRQQVIDGFIVDFYCHEVGLVLEVDGNIHRDQAQYDMERDTALKTHGLRVLRVTNEEVRKDLSGVLARIADAIGHTT